MFQKLRYFLILKAIKHLTPTLYLKLKRFSQIGSLYIVDWKNKFPNNYIRPFIKLIKKHFKNKELIGVEIGVFKGKNALSILKNLNIKKLYLIDIWKHFTQFNINRDNSEMFNLVLNRFKDNKKVEIIRDFSINVCKSFKDNSLDFAYIDANHQYDCVYNDIKNWFDKIKINGVLCGHDIGINDVCNALIDYCLKNKIKFFIESPDWYIIKKKNL